MVGVSIFTLLTTYVLFSDFILSIISTLTIVLIIRLFKDSNERLPFFEFVSILYVLNYLISPYITYRISSDLVQYPMKLSEEIYFDIMVPGVSLFLAGLYLTGIHNKFRFPDSRHGLKIGSGLLIVIVILGAAFGLLREVFGLGYIFYLLEQLGHVAALLLLSEYRSKFILWKVLPLGVKFIISFYTGFYHDLLIWLILYGFWISLIYKLSLNFKIQLSVVLIVFIFFIQAIKFGFREAVVENDKESKFKSVFDVSSTAIEDDKLFSEANLLSTLNRANQSWILASTVDNMDRTKDFQGVDHFGMYIESALLPRFISPNKLVSGDKSIFNRYSGHQINSSTSMGLGVFADGYIAGGKYGLYVAALLFGLLISFFSSLIVNWMSITPYYLVLLFPIFSYAVRPDCEFQTALNHIFKTTIFLFIFVQISKYRFAFGK